MQSLWRFLSYNNAVPVILTVLLSGAGATFAAVNPDAVYDAQESVVSVDNSYIANKDLSSFQPRIDIVGVSEDEEKYYVSYKLTTIDVVDAVWQDVIKNDVLTVAKGVLGEYGDLGLYATEQFNQIIDRQISYLKEVQEIERRAITPKVVATEYSGLVGRFLDTSTEELPGYVPVVTPPIEIAADPSVASQVAAAAGGSQPAAPTVSVSGNAGAPNIEILGPNPQTIPVGANFADMGVVASDDSGYVPTITVYVEGKLFSERPVTVDSSSPGTWHIQYRAVDTDGNATVAERVVIVEASQQNAPVASPPATTDATPPNMEPASTTEPTTTETSTTTP